MFLTNPFLWQKTLRLAAVVAAVTVATRPAGLSRSYRLAGTSRAVSITTNAATLRCARRIAAQTGTATIGVPAQRVLRGRTIKATAAGITLTPRAAFLQRSRIIGFLKADVTIEPQAANLLYGRAIKAQVATVTVEPRSVNFLKVAGQLQALPAAVALAGQSAQMRVSRKLLLSAGEALAAPQAAFLSRGRLIAAGRAGIEVAAPAVLIKYDRRIAAVSRAISVAGQDANLTYTQVLKTLTHLGSTTGNVSGVSFPAGIAVGDLAILIDHASTNGSTPASVAIPSGWTRVGSDVTGGSASRTRRARMLVKIMTSGDVAAGSISSSLINGGSNSRKDAHFYTGNIPITAFTTGALSSAVSDGNPAGQSIAASAGTAPLILVAYFVSSADPASRSSFTGYVESQGDFYTALRTRAINQPSTPTDVSFDMGDNGDGNLIMGTYIACT